MRVDIVSYYGADKIRERKISYADVPNLNSLKPGWHKVMKKVGSRELVAWYKVCSDAVVLATAYWRQK